MTETPEETDAPTPARPVLLCYDGSDGAKHAIEVAHEITGDCPAIVLHLWEPPAGWMMSADVFGTMPVWSPDQLSQVDAVVRERAGRLLAEGVSQARELGYDARGELDAWPSSLWRRILELADDEDAKLVVVGARGLSAVESAILGSTSNAIVHHAKRPVLVVPVLKKD
jgi:nucleotide-binding universal stress UspA family protein